MILLENVQPILRMKFRNFKKGESIGCIFRRFHIICKCKICNLQYEFREQWAYDYWNRLL